MTFVQGLTRICGTLQSLNHDLGITQHQLDRRCFSTLYSTGKLYLMLSLATISNTYFLQKASYSEDPEGEKAVYFHVINGGS